MLETVGHRVVALHRARFDGLTDAGLLPGQARRLSAAELQRCASTLAASDGSPGAAQAAGPASASPLYWTLSLRPAVGRGWTGTVSDTPRDGVTMRLNPVLEKLTPVSRRTSAGRDPQAIPPRAGVPAVGQREPWGPFPEVIEAMKGALDGLNRYPDGACSELRGLLAERLGVPEDRLTFGNGSCELLMLLGEAFLGPGRHAVFPHPSFVMYRSIALAHGALVHRGGASRIWTTISRPCWRRSGRTRAFLSSAIPTTPPAATSEPGAARLPARGCRPDVAVVLDEAYGEFVTSPARQMDSVAWLAEFPNLVILRTFSKIFGLAGLRVGYGIADPQVVQALDKVRQPFNVDSLAQVAAVESLRLPERIEERQTDGRRRAGPHGGAAGRDGRGLPPQRGQLHPGRRHQPGHPRARGGPGPAGDGRAHPLGLRDGMPRLDSGYHR